MSSSGFINIAVKAAYKAGNFIQQSSRNLDKIKIIEKGVHDLATEIDQKAETIIIDVLNSAYPEHSILAEESGSSGQTDDSEYIWIVDPIDGTTNFIHGHPQYSVSIALKCKDKIIAGVIFDPNRNDIYTAQIGKGAYMNDRRIRVSKTARLNEALLATGFPSTTPSVLDDYIKMFREMLLKTRGQRRMGSAALDLAYVANGSLDGFWEFNLKPWDIAAGYLLVKEAGGLFFDFEGNNQKFWDTGNIIAGNPKIANETLKIIKQYNT